MQEAQASPPNRPGVSGTKLIHYGPIWDRSLDSDQEGKERPVAVLVCHLSFAILRFDFKSPVVKQTPQAHQFSYASQHSAH